MLARIVFALGENQTKFVAHVRGNDGERLKDADGNEVEFTEAVGAPFIDVAPGESLSIDIISAS